MQHYKIEEKIYDIGCALNTLEATIEVILNNNGEDQIKVESKIENSNTGLCEFLEITPRVLSDYENKLLNLRNRLYESLVENNTDERKMKAP